MKIIENQIKKREPVTIALVLFCLSIAIGCVFAKIAQGLWEVDIDSINSRYFSTIAQMKIHYKDLLRHVFLSDMKRFLIIWIMSLTILGLPYLGFTIVSTGFQIGYLLTVLVLHYQWKGGLLFLAYYFPQCIIYIPVSLLCLKNCFLLTMEMNHSGLTPSLHNITMLKKYLKIIIILVGAIAIGAVTETFAGSYLVRKAIGIL